MTTNQTIDGVPRDSVLQLIEFLADAKAYHKVVIGRCEDCIKSGESSEREEYGRIGYRTEKIEQVERLSEELRALLDAPVNPLSEIEVLRAAVKELESMRDARVDAKLAKGEPVAKVVLDQRNLATLELLVDFIPVGTYLYEQPAPVAVVMPEFEQEFESWWESDGQYCRAGGGSYEKTFAYRAYEAALAEVKRLNTNRPAHANPPPGTKTSGTHPHNDGLDEMRKPK